LKTELSVLTSLRRALESAGQGMGMAQALVRELGATRPSGADAARMLLLGRPLGQSLQRLAEGELEEVSMLSSLMASVPKSSTKLVSASGGALAGTFENWVKARDSLKLEQKVMRFRSLIASGVLGAVVAMIATLGPVVGSLDLSGGGPTLSPNSLVYASAALTAVSSAMLGLFMSGRGFYLNVLVSLGVFGLVSLVASPLANVPSVNLWGVK
jgi:hypothetical protein